MKAKKSIQQLIDETDDRETYVEVEYEQPLFNADLD